MTYRGPEVGVQHVPAASLIEDEEEEDVEPEAGKRCDHREGRDDGEGGVGNEFHGGGRVKGCGGAAYVKTNRCDAEKRGKDVVLAEQELATDDHLPDDQSADHARRAPCGE